MLEKEMKIIKGSKREIQEFGREKQKSTYKLKSSIIFVKKEVQFLFS